MNRTIALLLLGAGLMGVAAGPVWSADAPPSAPVASPFDKADPLVQQLKQLKWKEIDFAAQDLKTRCAATLALSQVLGNLDAKASARIDLLVDYLNQQKLGEAFAAQQGEIPAPLQISYEDARKIAVALVQGPMGTGKFDADLEDCTDNMLKAYLSMYEKTAQRAFGDTIESRHYVRAMGLFLEKQGKLEDFSKWADAEQKRRQQVFEQELNRKRELVVKEAVARKEQAQAAAEERRRLDQEAAARNLEAAMQYQQQQVAGDPQTQTVVVDNGHWNGSTWYPGTGAYYASEAYRGYVRGKVGDAYRNWRPRPTPRARPGR